MATRIAGATCTTQRLVLSPMAFHTRLMESVSRSAPTGHTTVHCPQKAQLLVPRGRSIAGLITVSKPRFWAFSTPVPCISPHTVTQRRRGALAHVARDGHRVSGCIQCSPSNASRLRPAFCPAPAAHSSGCACQTGSPVVVGQQQLIQHPARVAHAVIVGVRHHACAPEPGRSLQVSCPPPPHADAAIQTGALHIAQAGYRCRRSLPCMMV